MKLNPNKLLPVSIVFASALILAACQAPVEETLPSVESTPTTEQSGTEQSGIESNSMVTELRTIGTYQSPAGSEEVGFVLFVDESGLITGAESQVLAENPTSKFRQTSFADAFADAVVGKNINDLENVDRIGGSSLTTGSFNRSLEDLKAQAV